MIKVTSLNKYYHKNKSNELHVINDVSLELPNNGLVAFLGKSGCGKTTLLNVIGGLDKQHSGTITYDDLEFKKYKMRELDEYRKENIGYIFQNYLLLEDMTVTDNLKATLEIIDIKDKDEQEKRIEYALKAVGLYRYRKKRAKNLSGGEMQRVSIARSLVKNCRLIIADEPTGNLDRENTLEIMNILKKISQNTLVLLVTHNEEMAHAFADRIIKIKDGKIIEDSINERNGKLQDKSDKKIYLKELDHKSLNQDNISFDIYQEENTDLHLKLFIKNDTIYFQTDKKMINIDNANIDLIDDYYQKEIKIDNNNYQFDISWFNNKKDKSFWKSLKTSLKSSWNDFIYTNKKGKVFRFIFFMIGILIASCVISFANYYSQNNDFEKTDAYAIYQDSYFYSKYPNVNGLQHQDLVDLDLISNIYSYGDTTISVQKNLNSSLAANYIIDCHLYPMSLTTDDKLLAGDYPINQNEVVITKNIASKIIENELLTNYNDVIGKEINNFIITGIINDNNNAIYSADLFYLQAIITNLEIEKTWYDVSKGAFYFGSKDEFAYKIIEGTDEFTNNDQIIVSKNIFDYYNLKINDIIKFSWKEESKSYNENVEIVGVFESTEEYDLNKPKYGFITNNNRLRNYFTDISEIYNHYFNKEFLQMRKNYSYATKNTFLVMNLNDIKDKEYYDFKITSGRLPENDNEILINDHFNAMLNNSITLEKKSYKVVGTYSTNKGIEHVQYIIAKDKTYLNILASLVDVFVKNYQFYPVYQVKDLEKLNLYLEDKNFSVNKISEYQLLIQEDETKIQREALLLAAGFLLLISLIYIYFSTRASIFNEVKSIGVYRSIGKTRLQIIKSYISNIFVKVSMTSLLGYILTLIIVISFNINMSDTLGLTLINMNFGIYIIGIIIMYLLNIIVGLIPVLRLMKNTPSEINSKYDV